MSAGAASPTARRETPFEHPAFEPLYSRVLRDVADGRLEPATRKAAARAIAFLLTERVVDEAVVTDILTALHKSLDLSKVVRTLLLALREALGDHEKIAEWTRRAVDRASKEAQLPAFVSALRVLVDLRDYDGTVPTRWRLSLLRAVEIPGLSPGLLLLTRAYGRRFGGDSWWLRTVRVRSTIAMLRQGRRGTASAGDET